MSDTRAFHMLMYYILRVGSDILLLIQPLFEQMDLFIFLKLYRPVSFLR